MKLAEYAFLLDIIFHTETIRFFEQINKINVKLVYLGNCESKNMKCPTVFYLEHTICGLLTSRHTGLAPPKFDLFQGFLSSISQVTPCAYPSPVKVYCIDQISAIMQ